MYSDYVCPFCYIGIEVLSRYREQRDVPLEVEWHPFDLRSGKRRPDGSVDTSIDDGKGDDYYEQARENVQRLRETYDVEMCQDLATDADSWNAQQASLYVREEHPNPLGGVRRCGVRGTLGRRPGYRRRGRHCVHRGRRRPRSRRCRETLANETWADRLETAHDEASQVGITGVPTFVSGGHAARGAVPPDHLRRLVEGALTD